MQRMMVAAAALMAAAPAMATTGGVTYSVTAEASAFRPAPVNVGQTGSGGGPQFAYAGVQRSEYDSDRAGASAWARPGSLMTGSSALARGYDTGTRAQAGAVWQDSFTIDSSAPAGLVTFAVKLGAAPSIMPGPVTVVSSETFFFIDARDEEMLAAPDGYGGRTEMGVYLTNAYSSRFGNFWEGYTANQSWAYTPVGFRESSIYEEIDPSRYRPGYYAFGYGIYRFTMPFNSGQRIDIGARLSCKSTASNFDMEPRGSAQALCFAAARWLGLASLTDFDGNPIAGSFTSPSGFRFDRAWNRQLPGAGITSGSPVPEPASWAMLIAGFGLTGAAARRRHMLSAAV